jgi:putative addiction module component (TIGR02574 family)
MKNNIDEKDELLEINEATKTLLDERLDAHQNNPQEGSVWTEVKARIKKRL